MPTLLLLPYIPIIFRHVLLGYFHPLYLRSLDQEVIHSSVQEMDMISISEQISNYSLHLVRGPLIGW